MKLLSDLRVKGLNGSGILPEGIFPWRKYVVYPGREAFGFPWPKTDTFEEDSIRPCPEGVPVELTVQHWFDKNDVKNHPNAEHFFKPKAGLARFMSVDEGDDSRKSFKRLHRWRYSPTACYGNNEVHIHPYKPRRISVAEALAIQSMPKEFVFPPNMTLTDMFKAIGNGVPYIASRALAKSISDFLRC
jgi:DNA (cytosine-5)-methyltransferase 1